MFEENDVIEDEIKKAVNLSMNAVNLSTSKAHIGNVDKVNKKKTYVEKEKVEETCVEDLIGKNFF